MIWPFFFKLEERGVHVQVELKEENWWWAPHKLIRMQIQFNFTQLFEALRGTSREGNKVKRVEAPTD